MGLFCSIPDIYPSNSNIDMLPINDLKLKRIAVTIFLEKTTLQSGCTILTFLGKQTDLLLIFSKSETRKAGE
jgi:hypothetical protein